MTKKLKTEFDIVKTFSSILGLENKTDGTLHIYNKKDKTKPQSTKPDGYYYYEGITFILDAKAEGKNFTGQLEDYMEQEQNENYIGFKYNGTEFKCYIKGKLIFEEKELKDKNYYKDKYFPIKKNNFEIVNQNAIKLANLFRYSNIDKQLTKQLNVPFIGIVFLNIMYGHEINLETTKTIIKSLQMGLNEIIKENSSIVKRQKKQYLMRTLEESTLLKAKTEDLINILSVISNIYNFINISQEDYEGHDIMNTFLRVFRKWNSANANEKGEVFTPDHIAQLMYKLCKIDYTHTVLDPTCGSGTFLTNAMALMIRDVYRRERERERERWILTI